jgi:hypothetical protein
VPAFRKTLLHLRIFGDQAGIRSLSIDEPNQFRDPQRRVGITTVHKDLRFRLVSPIIYTLQGVCRIPLPAYAAGH